MTYDQVVLDNIDLGSNHARPKEKNLWWKYPRPKIASDLTFPDRNDLWWNRPRLEEPLIKQSQAKMIPDGATYYFLSDYARLELTSDQAVKD